MNYRKLRIAWTVWWGILCLLLIALSMRSYWRQDSVASQDHSIIFGSNSGTVYFIHTLELILSGDSVYPSRYRSDPASEPRTQFIFLAHYPTELPQPWPFLELHISTWLPITFIVLVAVCPWLPWRFSLRTLLIAITLVAMTLGTIIATTR